MSDPKRKSFGILKIAAIVALLLVAAMIALPFLLDVNQFRPKLESTLSNALGREIKIGDLSLSLLGGSVGVKDIVIADNPAFSDSPFVTAKSLKARVELKPLIFDKEIRITGISLDRPSINLIRSSSGKWNFSDLGSRHAGAEETAASDSARILESRALIKELKINGGRITVTQGNRKPTVYEDVNITAGNLSFTTPFPFTITASLPGGGTLKLDGVGGPLSPTDLLATPMTASLLVDKFDLVSSGFAAPDSGLSGLLDFRGTATSDGRRVTSEGHADAGNLQVVKGGSPAARPIGLDYRLDYDLVEKSGTVSNVKVQCGAASAQLNGTYSIQQDGAVLKMKLRGVNMPVQDLTALLPAFGVTLPKGASLEGGSMNVDLTAEGPVDRLITEGTADIAGTRLAGFDLAGKLSALAALAGIQSNQQTEIEKFSSAMKMTPDGIQVSNLLLEMPVLGKLTGAGKIAPDQTLDFTMLANLKPSAGVGSVLTRLSAGKGLNLPFFVRGTASEPKFVPDTKNAARSILGSAISGSESKEGGALGKALRGLFEKKQ
jgi:AsmA protein